MKLLEEGSCRNNGELENLQVNNRISGVACKGTNDLNLYRAAGDGTPGG